MKALVYNGPYDVSVESVPAARIEQPNTAPSSPKASTWAPASARCSATTAACAT